MHKKLEAELVSIAHSILQMKNRDDIAALYKKAQKLHEKLAILLFIDDYLITTPNVTQTREELIAKVEKAVIQEPIKAAEKVIKKINEDKPIVDKEIKAEKTLFELKSTEKTKEAKKEVTFEEELKGTVSVDVTAGLFKKEVVNTDSKASLNDKLLQKNIQVGLNDRIAFVKPDYDWSGKEEYEERLLALVERRFL